MAQSGRWTPVCPYCNTKITRDLMNINGRQFHSTCLRCEYPDCKTKLNNVNYTSHRKGLYCKQHMPTVLAESRKGTKRIPAPQDFVNPAGISQVEMEKQKQAEQAKAEALLHEKHQMEEVKFFLVQCLTSFSRYGQQKEPP